MMLEDASMAAKLSAFGIQVERESRGGVSLRQLGRDDAQGRRCIQAALENIRPSFLDRTPFSEMKAVHVYKVENKSLLSRFHTHADGLAPSKVSDAPRLSPPLFYHAEQVFWAAFSPFHIICCRSRVSFVLYQRVLWSDWS
jgi:hypothetical protein